MTQQDFIFSFVHPSPEDAAGGRDEIVRKIRQRLQALRSDEQFQVLFPMAVKSQSVDGLPVLDAALLLKELGPECAISCEAAVEALLPEWDVSIEEVPFYLVGRFGARRVRQAIANLEPRVTDKSQRATLDTVSYWIRVYEETRPQSNSQG